MKKNMFKKIVKRVAAIVMIFMTVVTVSTTNKIYAVEVADILPEIVKEYVNIVNENNYGDLFKISSKENKQIYHSIYKNDDNINEHIGISNVSNIEIIDFLNLEDVSEILLDGYSDVDNSLLEYCIVKTSLCVFDSELDPFKDGINYLIFAIKNENNGQKVHDVIYLDELMGEEFFPSVSTYTADEPVESSTGKIWTVPSSIRVLLVDTNEVKTVGFKEYCYIVTANEAYSDFDVDAIKAIALSVKNFGWRRMLSPRFYSDKNYDIRSDDQCYDVAKAEKNNAVTESIISSVDAIWNYVMLDNEYGLMVGFHRKNKEANKNARKNGGILSQDESQELAKEGYTWQEILHYYYDRKKGDNTYYNLEVAEGEIIIFDHNHQLVVKTSKNDDYYHWSICNECPYYHYKTPHSIVYLGGGVYGCNACRYMK